MRSESEDRSLAGPLWAAGLCLAGLALTWVIASLVPVVHTRDAVALYDFTQLDRPGVQLLAGGLLALLSPPLYTLWGALIIAVALKRTRPALAAAAFVVLALAPLSAEVLKPLLAHPHAQVGFDDISGASWPSGHSTAAMALALCAVLVAPRRLRPALAAVGSAFAIAVGFSLLILAWHMPSDVFGGYLLAALFVSLAVAALRARERRPARRRSGAAIGGRELLVPALLIATLAIAILVALVLRTHQVEAFASDHHALLIAAAGIAALAGTISGALTAALRN
jgi:membrane-associated phospholipid phosphatase